LFEIYNSKIPISFFMPPILPAGGIYPDELEGVLRSRKQCHFLALRGKQFHLASGLLAAITLRQGGVLSPKIDSYNS
jgi:hypothetical protein